MNRSRARRSLRAAVLLLLVSPVAWAQLEPSCARDSPERRGETGCSLVEDKPLPATLKGPLFWHIDRFDSEDGAQAAVGPVSLAFQAHGTWWLFTLEPKVNDHHGGHHVKAVALPALPPASKYSMLAMSANVPAGLTSRVHHHSGVEGFYVVDGEQCLETQAHIYRMPKGTGLAVPTGVTMRLVATGSVPRKALAIIVYDSSQPPTTREETSPPPLLSCL